MTLHSHTRCAVLGLSLTLSTLFAACGGGGGDAGTPAGSAPPPPAPPPAAASFALALSTQKALIEQGHSVTLDATITRDAGFTDAVGINLTGLPTGVSATPVTIAAGATSAQIILSAEATAPHSLPTDASVRGPAGSLDTSFGGGTQISLVGIGEDYAEAMAVQSDGRIVVAGHSAMVQSTDFAVVRYLRDGGLDPSFGGTGKVVTALIPGSARDSIYALALQTVKGQAHIVAVGGEGDFAAARYTPSGALDASFDNGGKVTGLFGSIIGAARAVLVTPDNALILAGGIGATTTCWRAWARTAHWTAASVSAAS